MVSRKSSNISKSRGAAAGTRRLPTTTPQQRQQQGPGTSARIQHHDEEEKVEVGGAAEGAPSAAAAAAASPPASVAMPRLRQELYVQESKTRLKTGTTDGSNEKSKDEQPNDNKRAAIWDADGAAASPGAFHVSTSGGVDLPPDLHDVDLEEGSSHQYRGNISSHNHHLIGAHLVEADLVTDAPSPILVKATPVVVEPPSTEKSHHRDQDAEPSTSSRVSRRSLWIIIAVLTVVSAAAIAVGIIWGVKRVDDNATRGASSPTTTTNNTTSAVALAANPPSSVAPGSSAPSPPTAAFQAPSVAPSYMYENEGYPPPT
jgi:hypothetical protein